MAGADTGTAAKVFFSYAHEDLDLRNRLEEHLASLKHEGIISTWHDRNIGAGKDWAGVISDELEAAQIILLLISSSFLDSAYCYDREMHRALQRHEQGDAIVIPVILRPADWERAPFGKLQALPKDARPVTKWRNRDEAFKSIAIGIADAVAQVRSPSYAPPQAPRESRIPGQPASHGIAEALKHLSFVLIRPGTFLMGSTKEPEEKPVHEVTITKEFHMGTHIVTQGEWRAVMDTEPWKGREYVREGDTYPAVYVSWEDAKAFIAKLNAFDAENYYRLPTEAEWEYAARAGTSTDFSFGDDERALNAYGWYKGNSYDAGFRHAHEVGQKRPNPWGLYDLHGNVWEWVEDWFRGSYDEDPRRSPVQKVLRGGGYDFPPSGARSAFRNKELPIRSNHVIGFRLVKEPL